uniref:Beta-lactamase-related domain-containing protein n=1 Tax=Parascaris univalens TaxID=6257 RepID=A0A915CDH5_PARUN
MNRMIAAKNCILIAIVAAIVYIINNTLYTHLPLHIDGGYTEMRFKRVVEAFRKNFEDGWERDGAALAVYHKGKKVVDVWGGYADKQAARKWQKDTLTVTFSTTKAVAAICIAMLVDRGAMHYEDLVTKHWPEFGKNGKANITIQMALSHTAGLAYVDEPITEQIAADHKAMRTLLENETPKWPPGTMTGYHVYTYGWIVDQLVRSADKNRRGVGQFFREEIAQKFDIDYFIGLPPEEQYRVTRLSLPTLADSIAEIFTDLRVVKYFFIFIALFRDSMLARAVGNPSWLRAVFQLTVNNPDYHRLEQAAALGIGNARSLGKIFSLISSGQLFDEATFEKLKRIHINETDIVLYDQLAKGNGMLYFDVNRAGARYALGHTGHGCQQITYDPFNDLTIAYVANGLKTGLYTLCRTYARLHSSVYDALENIAYT